MLDLSDKNEEIEKESLRVIGYHLTRAGRFHLQQTTTDIPHFFDKWHPIRGDTLDWDAVENVQEVSAN